MKRPKALEVPRTAWRAHIETVAAQMAAIFGPQNVLAHSEHHLQIRHADRLHDIWVRGDNSVRFKANGGKKGVLWAQSAAGIAHAIEQTAKNKPVNERLKAVMELATFVRWAQKHLPQGVKEAIFCDAGLKGHCGIASAVWVCRVDGGVESAARSIPVSNVKIDRAEYIAICLGVSMLLHHGSIDCPIYSDSQSAVFAASKEEGVGDQVRWLSREHNKLADSLANVRHVKETP